MAYTITNISLGSIGINGELIPPQSIGRKLAPIVSVEMAEFKRRGLLTYTGYDDVVSNTDQFKKITAATYTLVADDAGKVLRFLNDSPVTVTLPGDLQSGFACLWRQIGAGKLSFVLAVTNPSQNLRNVDGYTKSAAQYAEGSLSVDDETKDWYLSGTCGT